MYHETTFLKLLSGVVSQRKKIKIILIRSGVQILRGSVYSWLGSHAVPYHRHFKHLWKCIKSLVLKLLPLEYKNNWELISCFFEGRRQVIHHPKPSWMQFQQCLIDLFMLHWAYQRGKRNFLLSHSSATISLIIFRQRQQYIALL